MALNFSFYNDAEEEEWDKFVLEKSMNGIFLQTRKFINYHPKGKFKDSSICVRKGNELVAVILGCELDDGGKMFFAHRGSTFGGITLSKTIYSATSIDELISGFLAFLRENGFKKCFLKMVPTIYQKKQAELVDYFLHKNNFYCYNELNYYLDLNNYKDDILAQFTANKRRDYRYSLKNDLSFKELSTKEEIAEYYEVLLKNLKKLNLNPVHTYEELCDLKFNRFNENVEFYGVFKDNKMIAGSMLFYFNNDIVHTQYLSSDEEYLSMFPMDFLIYNLIKVGVEKNKKIFSFGICTEDRGKYLNLGLSRFKEGFGTDFCINKSYEIELKEEEISNV